MKHFIRSSLCRHCMSRPIVVPWLPCYLLSQCNLLYTRQPSQRPRYHSTVSVEWPMYFPIWMKHWSNCHDLGCDICRHASACNSRESAEDKSISIREGSMSQDIYRTQYHVWGTYRTLAHTLDIVSQTRLVYLSVHIDVRRESKKHQRQPERFGHTN